MNKENTKTEFRRMMNSLNGAYRDFLFQKFAVSHEHSVGSMEKELWHFIERQKKESYDKGVSEVLKSINKGKLKKIQL